MQTHHRGQELCMPECACLAHALQRADRTPQSGTDTRRPGQAIPQRGCLASLTATSQMRQSSRSGSPARPQPRRPSSHEAGRTCCWQHSTPAPTRAHSSTTPESRQDVAAACSSMAAQACRISILKRVHGNVVHLCGHLCGHELIFGTTADYRRTECCSSLHQHGTSTLPDLNPEVSPLSTALTQAYFGHHSR